jgi:polyhydroxyalkanoate synthase subunit PhaC
MRRHQDYLRGLNHISRQAPPSPQRRPRAQRHDNIQLIDYAARAKTAPVILVIPSIINRPDILDLDPERSLLRGLKHKGFRPILLDWGRFDASDHALTLSDLVTRARQALQRIKAETTAPIHLMGHCLGGIFGLALATEPDQACRSLILLSSPWDFHAESPILRHRAQQSLREIRKLLPADRLVPPAILQSAFALLQPAAVIEKFRQDNLPQNPVELRRFLRVEAWLNDGVALPQPILRGIVEDWYGKNQTMSGLWHTGRNLLDPRRAALPTLIMTPAHDHIVAPASAAALAKLLPNAESHTVPLGHIGLIISRQAPQLVWEKLYSWLESKS